MTIHYHGLPLTPEIMLLDLAGRHVCISFATKRDAQVQTSLRLMQSIMFDNGAFTIHQQGGELDVAAYYDWLKPMLRHPHWAVVPDHIGGDENAQRVMVETWPFPKAFGAPVWHLGLSLDYLIELASEWPRICFGSSEDYWKVGSPSWRGRMHDAFAALEAAGQYPHIHGLRMMNEAGKWPLASVDSVNVSRNYKDREDMPGRMADRLDRVNAPLNFQIERRLFDAA
ncbi:hypothetical protein [Pseudaminobacter salicylatoxidans]|uniref:hypothetical protein n=1 Tax=Pseudaminobacter salicylatoxidans TaxID=93369 RepID=UPI00036B0EC8|nr:hypothetical protein [Pseudaminobacter salicylatoxidans]